MWPVQYKNSVERIVWSSARRTGRSLLTGAAVAAAFYRFTWTDLDRRGETWRQEVLGEVREVVAVRERQGQGHDGGGEAGPGLGHPGGGGGQEGQD